MTRREEWDVFLSRLRLRAWEEFQKTREYACRKQREEELEQILEDNLSENQKHIVDEVLWELGLAADHEGKDFYAQGMRDCVWMLRTLGVLA